MRSRSEVIKLATSWLGKKESDGSYKSIIDLYNKFEGPMPRGIKMQYGWPWCACMWSAIAIALGYTDVMPIEISCNELIKKAKDMGCWQENDSYTPEAGDGIVYDWNDNGNGDNVGWPDHVGVVERCDTSSGYITVIEGNYNNSVKKRTISINGKYIRGFITPKYTDNVTFYDVSGSSKDIEVVAREVISGLWGTGHQRKCLLESNGINYSKVQEKVNEILNGLKSPFTIETSKNVESTCYAKNKNSALSGRYVTTSNLYCRNDAGTNKKALCLIPKGTTVYNYGYYTNVSGKKWLLITFSINGIKYTGFSHEDHLKKE